MKIAATAIAPIETVNIVAPIADSPDCSRVPLISNWYRARDLVDRHGRHTCPTLIAAMAYISAGEED